MGTLGAEAYWEGGPEEGGDDGGTGGRHGRLAALSPQWGHCLNRHVLYVAVYALAVRDILQHHLHHAMIHGVVSTAMAASPDMIMTSSTMCSSQRYNAANNYR